tara:strand:- start:509 stop:691 length:183 start_codon:yes stop_codon:yes gene_type:complete
LLPGTNNGLLIARTEAVTLFARKDQLSLLKGLRLNYLGDLSGGVFLISPPDKLENCACGS